MKLYMATKELLKVLATETAMRIHDAGIPANQENIKTMESLVYKSYCSRTFGKHQPIGYGDHTVIRILALHYYEQNYIIGLDDARII